MLVSLVKQGLYKVIKETGRIVVRVNSDQMVVDELIQKTVF